MRNRSLINLLAVILVVGGGAGTPQSASASQASIAFVNDKGGEAPSVPADANQTDPNQDQKQKKITFPYFIPGSRIVIGKELVDEVNGLSSKEKQIQFLIQILPPADQEKKRFTDRQLYAIRMLSLTESDSAIAPLLDRLGFQHQGDASSCVQGLSRLGERAVEPLVQGLQRDKAADAQTITNYAVALQGIKKERFSQFVDDLKRRDDIQIPEKVLKDLKFRGEFFGSIR